MSSEVEYTYETIRRIRKRMQMKVNRLLHLAGKMSRSDNKHISKGSGSGAALILRAHTWQNACVLLDEELEALEWQMKKKKI